MYEDGHNTQITFSYSWLLVHISLVRALKPTPHFHFLKTTSVSTFIVLLIIYLHFYTIVLRRKICTYNARPASIDPQVWCLAGACYSPGTPETLRCRSLAGSSESQRWKRSRQGSPGSASAAKCGDVRRRCVHQWESCRHFRHQSQSWPVALGSSRGPDRWDCTSRRR